MLGSEEIAIITISSLGGIGCVVATWLALRGHAAQEADDEFGSSLAAASAIHEFGASILVPKKQLDEEEVAALSRLLEEAEKADTQVHDAADEVRERTRRRIAYILIGTLVAVVLGTIVYIIGMFLTSGDMTLGGLSQVIPMVGTVLLTPLVGLIGAVMGFYYGGQTAGRGMQTATKATQQVKGAAYEFIEQVADGKQPQSDA